MRGRPNGSSRSGSTERRCVPVSLPSASYRRVGSILRSCRWSSSVMARRAVFGRYGGPPTRAELDRMFYLDDEDLRLISKRRGDHMRLGFSLQLTTVRYLGTFLVDPLDVPPLVTGHLARQLGIGVPISPVPASAPGQLGSPHPALRAPSMRYSTPGHAPYRRAPAPRRPAPPHPS